MFEWPHLSQANIGEKKSDFPGGKNTPHSPHHAPKKGPRHGDERLEALTPKRPLQVARGWGEQRGVIIRSNTPSSPLSSGIHADHQISAGNAPFRKCA
jgi:hypothetical protein